MARYRDILTAQYIAVIRVNQHRALLGINIIYITLYTLYIPAPVTLGPEQETINKYLKLYVYLYYITIVYYLYNIIIYLNYIINSYYKTYTIISIYFIENLHIMEIN